jgi:hypothetical protein
VELNFHSAMLFHAVYKHKSNNIVFFFPETNNVNKVKRPPNAFMLYCKEKRREMASLFPEDGNKNISKM